MTTVQNSLSLGHYGGNLHAETAARIIYGLVSSDDVDVDQTVKKLWLLQVFA